MKRGGKEVSVFSSIGSASGEEIMGVELLRSPRLRDDVEVRARGSAGRGASLLLVLLRDVCEGERGIACARFVLEVEGETRGEDLLKGFLECVGDFGDVAFSFSTD